MNQTKPASETISLENVRQAAGRIAGHAHRTPVITNRTINELVGLQIFFKCENLQRTGSFKFRGACNAVAMMTAEELKRGVVTHSSGNHAGAIACAARQFGTTATVVMPVGSNAVKKAAVIHYGGNVVECENNEAARTATADRIVTETGANLIPPFDDARIIAGQGTAALEILDEVPDLDCIMAPVGGGGLLAGTCIAAKKLRADIRVFAAEPDGANDAWQSLQKQERIPLQTASTIADGLRTSLGHLNWPIIQSTVEDIVTVSDEEIVIAMRQFWMFTKLIIEPSSAVPLAALRKSPFKSMEPQTKVGIILSGGNVDLDRLPW